MLYIAAAFVAGACAIVCIHAAFAWFREAIAPRVFLVHEDGSEETFVPRGSRGHRAFIATGFALALTAGWCVGYDGAIGHPDDRAGRHGMFVVQAVAPSIDGDATTRCTIIAFDASDRDRDPAGPFAFTLEHPSACALLHAHELPVILRITPNGSTGGTTATVVDVDPESFKVRSAEGLPLITI